MRRAVVIGAGLAGLSAAVRLTDAGFAVRLLDSRRLAGGRVRRVRPRPGHRGIDCGQHLLLGCYRESRALAKRLRSEHLLEPVRGLTPFLSGPGRVHPYRPGRMPAPLHLLPGLTGLTHLRKRERLGLGLVFAAAKTGLRTRPAALDETDAATWLRGLGQSRNALAGFWDPLVTATLNTSCDKASAHLLAGVLSKGFLASREDAQPMLPRTSLHELFVCPAIEAVREGGGRVELGRGVTRLLPGPARGIRAVQTKGGELVEGDLFVLAVPSWRVGPILDELPGLEKISESLEALGSSPIIGIDLWYERPWMPYPYAALLGSPIQWVFRHGYERNDEFGGHRVSLVMSDAGRHMTLRRGELVETARGELARYFPEAAKSSLSGSMVTKVRRATFRGRPGQRSLRPGAATGYHNLYLAGDWTATDLPATIESAVMSGARAADEAVAGVVSAAG